LHIPNVSIDAYNFLVLLHFAKIYLKWIFPLLFLTVDNWADPWDSLSAFGHMWQGGSGAWKFIPFVSILLDAISRNLFEWLKA